MLVDSNVEFAADILKKFIDESISVNKVHGIKSKRIAEYIIHSRPEWTNFYENNYRSSLDFVLREKVVLVNKAPIAKSSSAKVAGGGGAASASKSWELRLTGFNEDVGKFVEEFEKKFRASKERERTRHSVKEQVGESWTK